MKIKLSFFLFFFLLFGGLNVKSQTINYPSTIASRIIPVDQREYIKNAFEDLSKQYQAISDFRDKIARKYIMSVVITSRDNQKMTVYDMYSGWDNTWRFSSDYKAIYKTGITDAYSIKYYADYINNINYNTTTNIAVLDSMDAIQAKELYEKYALSELSINKTLQELFTKFDQNNKEIEKNENIGWMTMTMTNYTNYEIPQICGNLYYTVDGTYSIALYNTNNCRPKY